MVLLRSIVSLAAGTLLSALAIAAVSVYVFHDVDADRIGYWNRAFLELGMEAFGFALLIGIGVGLLSLPFLFSKRTRPGTLHARRLFALGVFLPIAQYACDALVRHFLPRSAQQGLLVYLALAILLSSGLLLRWGHAGTSIMPGDATA